MNMLEKSEDIIAFIKNSKKKTPVKVYIKGNLENIKTNAKVFSFGDFYFISTLRIEDHHINLFFKCIRIIT